MDERMSDGAAMASAASAAPPVDPMPPFQPFSAHLSDAAHGLVILCDHAENRLPPAYGTLGVAPEQLERHIGYDIGAKALSERLAEALGATLVMSRFSRLLIDPNRGLDDPTLIMRLSDGAVVPGNARHDAAERSARIAQFYKPYDDAISRACEHVLAVTGRAPVLFSLHSFTPIWRGHPRPWHAGVLWDRDGRLAVPLIEALQAEGDLIVGDNEPYRGELPGDTMHRHGTLKGFPHALLEVRQDLIHDEDGVSRWADRLIPMLRALVEQDALRDVLPLPARRLTLAERATLNEGE
jgi:predicted N-formylglutamate amidohydrolase